MFDSCFRGFFRAMMRRYSRYKPRQAKMRPFYNRFRFPLSICGIVLWLSVVSIVYAAEDSPAIAAASDLKFALDTIAKQFSEETGQNVKLSFGSSGNFFRQISQGAPFEVFLSADEQYVFELEKQGLTEEPGQLYGLGRLVVFAPVGSVLAVDADLNGFADSLSKGQISRFAIANPEHAPYGRAAKEALMAKGLWDALQNKLVLGENVAQAAQFAVSGSAEGGIFAYSLALSPALRDKGTYALLPETVHSPLRQRMALLKNAGGIAKAFYRYLQQAKARAVFTQYGFALPDPGGAQSMPDSPQGGKGRH
jgi:molybdate transport system substrate-binding protein